MYQIAVQQSPTKSSNWFWSIPCRASEDFNQYFTNMYKQKHLLITAPAIWTQMDITCSNTLSLSPTDPREVFNIVTKIQTQPATMAYLTELFATVL